MKLLFLHLSDLHIKSNRQQVNLKIDKIVTALQSLGNVDRCIFIASGDLTYSGKIDEYKKVRIFIGTLLRKLGEKYNSLIDCFIVPGNHDMMITSELTTTSEIEKLYKRKIKEELDKAFYEELKLQDPFFEYANSKQCFRSDKVLDMQIKKYNNFVIQYNLLNTAPFCRPKKNIKGMLHLPDAKLFSLVKQDNVDLAITIMHHSTEWFNLHSKNELESKFKNYSDIVFQGHEHIPGTTKVDDLSIIKGGEYSGEFTHESTFSALIVDTESFECSEVKFKWDKDNTMFRSHNEQLDFHISPRKEFMLPNEKFVSQLLEDSQRLSEKFLDYFVFPKLKRNKKNATSDEIEFVSEKDFWNELFSSKKINITGKSRSGKTTLLRYLYMQCLDRNMVPLYLGSDHGVGKFAIKNVMKTLIGEQYGNQSITYEKYSQLASQKKVILIDDLHTLKNSENLLNAIENEVEYIIYTSENRINYDVIDATKDELLESVKGTYIIIEDFYKEKRTELVKKLCEFKQQNSNFIDFLMQTLDHYVRRRNGLFVSSPEYIVQFVKYFINKDVRDHRGEEVFNVVFETNLRNSIIEFSGEKNIGSCMLILEEISFFIHKEKNEVISYADIVSIVDELNESRALAINTKKCIDIIMNAKIINMSRKINNYAFANRNYLAYFIAKKLNGMIEKSGFNIPELQYVFTNICFGINDNILLFLSYLRNNTAFALSICALLNDIVQDFPELDFDNNNVSFLKRQRAITLSVPSENEKKKVAEALDDAERQHLLVESDDIQYESVYAYDENEADHYPNKIVKAMKYLEIISKSLISHWVNLNKLEKLRIVNLMYSAPNRLLYAMLKPYDDKYDELITEIQNFISLIPKMSKVERVEIEELFNKMASYICLHLYNEVAFFGANNDTLPLLNNESLKTSNYKIVNLIMEGNGASTSSFVDKAVKLKESEDDVFITNLIQIITYRHIMERTVSSPQLNRVASKILTGIPKQKLLINSMVSKAKKE